MAGGIKMNKFQKKYTTKTSTELLVYYAQQPDHVSDFKLSLVSDFLKSELHKSVFRRVWIYSFSEEEILLIYPPL